ncbi:hypothetical protein RR42_m3487 [Cupriavidus basilensis]|uniref:Uncharacterized protein n=1 Tax=Cupriavidus basilensis TaxID=68895 RepID=A0A0C4YD75_9BURK|nr:hypothetical protein RR42_m3487 [Cupriavidus basilensis]
MLIHDVSSTERGVATSRRIRDQTARFGWRAGILTAIGAQAMPLRTTRGLPGYASHAHGSYIRHKTFSYYAAKFHDPPSWPAPRRPAGATAY